jgi:cysteine synthase A
VDCFVAGVGTGGTLTGNGRRLKEHNPALTLVAVEPAKSPLLSGGTAAPHGLQGIGANFIPRIVDQTLIDRVIPVTEEDAYRTAREAAIREGLLIGISSGAALYAALELSKEEAFAGKRIVVLLPDSGERYLSTDLFQ